MKNYVTGIALVIFCLASCKNNGNQASSKFYYAMHGLLDKAEVQLTILGDSIVAINQHLWKDNAYVPDTNQLRTILHDAAMLNQSVIDSIELLEEYEPAAGLKSAGLRYAGLWQGAIKGIFEEWLASLTVDRENKAEFLQQLLAPKLKEIGDASAVLTEKNRFYKKNYGVQKK